MALDRKNLVQLMKTVARANASAPSAYSFNGTNYSYNDLNETLRKELNEYAGSFAQYRENKNLIFSLIEETVDDVLPKRVQEAYEMFAEVKTFGQGDKPLFRRKLSARTRAKQFITRVGLEGVYEVFKLGGEESFEVPTSAIGGAAQIGLEEFLDGRADFAELLAIVMEGMDELIYHEVGKALQGAIGQLPTNNVVATNDFIEKEFDRLLTIASAYGDPTIYCTNEFAVKMVPKEGWRYTEQMKGELWSTGRLATYKGRTVVILPQGIEDETNSRKTVDASWCWIIPNSGNGKPVKIALEGNTLVDERQNADWSRDVQVYKKVGVVALLTNDICVYRDTSLSSMDLSSMNLNAGIDGVSTQVEVVGSENDEDNGQGGNDNEGQGG